MRNTLWVANALQKALMEEEFEGQITDGHWENRSSEHDVRRICDMQVKVAEGSELRGRNFDLLRYYGLGSKELYSYVGDRMLELAKKFNPQVTEVQLKREIKALSHIFNTYVNQE